MSTLIVMMSPSGSGKSTLAAHIEKTHEDCIVVSRDRIRFAMLKDEDDYFKYEKEVEKAYYDAVTRALAVHKYVIADATQLTFKARNKLFKNVKRPAGTKVVGIWLEVPQEVAKKQNRNRSGRAFVPEDVIANQYRYKVSPTADEPFDDIIYVSGHTNQAVSRKGDIKNIFDKLAEI